MLEPVERVLKTTPFVKYNPEAGQQVVRALHSLNKLKADIADIRYLVDEDREEKVAEPLVAE